MRPERYVISLDRNVYFPGEVVTGSLRIQCSSDISCRGVRVHLQGKGHSSFSVGSGKNRRTVSHTQFYSNCKRTVFGSVCATPILQNAGSNAIFGPPWAPDEGILYMHLPAHAEDVVLRVMDYEWLKRDVVLGEVCVHVFDIAGKGIQEMALTRDGKSEQGTLSFSMEWDPSNNSFDGSGQALRGLKVTVLRALHLRSAGWVGANDVYVQAYPRTSPISTDKALPAPETSISLPAGDFRVPFEFKLPDDLPSSMLFNERNFITFSIYSNIDIAWQRDPSTRLFFTVLQPLSSCQLPTPVRQSIQQTLYTQFCLPPFCCCALSCFCSAIGKLSVSASTDRSGYAPGEFIRIELEYKSDWEGLSAGIKSITCEMIQHVHRWADNHHRDNDVRVVHPMTLKRDTSSFSIQVPSVPPTFAGGIGKNAAWFGEMARYGKGWSVAKPDPITWKYSIRITFKINLPGCAIVSKDFVLTLPVYVTAIGLSVLQPVSGDLELVNPEVNVKTSHMEREDIPVATALPISVNWQSDPRVRVVYPTALSTCQVIDAQTGGSVLRDEQEDLNTANVEALSYTPQYLMAPSAPPLLK